MTLMKSSEKHINDRDLIFFVFFKQILRVLDLKIQEIDNN